eukprot:CAMPEP_0115379048 /NCGR_PEP_ID=MMETSP0271-20121206/4329_1 /TAXON_ID=71861 /ORGANISM="Scrippsiella trochoidea, Strain CCMP3099" /LENGTH=90 /DNA_ID=CAMNT_0002802235 /DNA_START=119 /DNA_END=391 /DNA_ORIENTATION=-
MKSFRNVSLTSLYSSSSVSLEISYRKSSTNSVRSMQSERKDDGSCCSQAPTAASPLPTRRGPGSLFHRSWALMPDKSMRPSCLNSCSSTI